jgi:Ca2+-binding RTX toxin-like protein
MSGSSGRSVVAVARDTNAGLSPADQQNVSSILSGFAWSSGAAITYSFPTSSSVYGSQSSYGDPAPYNGFSVLTAQQQGEVVRAFGLIASYTNLTFTQITETSSTHAVVRLANSSSPPTAYAYYPSTSPTGGDVFYGGTGKAPVMGNFDSGQATLHEIGHALGLKHGQDNNTYGVMNSDRLDIEFSLMNYANYIGSTDGFSTASHSPHTYMMYDIAAFQYMYGANFSAVGQNRTYTWSSTTGEQFINGVSQGRPVDNHIFDTVWTQGATSTYDLSNFSQNQVDDMNPGGWMLFSTPQLADLNAFAVSKPSGEIFARADVYNALLFNGDARSLITNIITGSGADIITGNAANNTINGGAGGDTMMGGAGNDTYVVDNAGDTVTENANEGTDLVQASINYTLGGNVENLTLTGTAAINGTGNAANNTITGNTAANTLDGGGRRRHLDRRQWRRYLHRRQCRRHGDGERPRGTRRPGPGLAHLHAGHQPREPDPDRYRKHQRHRQRRRQYDHRQFRRQHARRRRRCRHAERRRRQRYLHRRQCRRHGDGGGQRGHRGSGQGIGQLHAGRQPREPDPDRQRGHQRHRQRRRQHDHRQRRRQHARRRRRRRYARRRRGLDILIGGAGNDTYIVDNALDTVTEIAAGDGTADLVQASVSFTLGLNLENLTLTGSAAINGTGNGAGNTIIGNAGTNTLDGGAGDDILDGGAGADALIGGAGNDTYVVDSAGDTVTETANEGTADLVQASISFTLGANLENLTLDRQRGDQRHRQRRRQYAHRQRRRQHPRRRRWRRHARWRRRRRYADRRGRQRYLRRRQRRRHGDGDRQRGTADLVQASISFTLGANLENLTLTGSGAINGTGNAAGNTITGNAGANTLDGAAGADTLRGGGGMNRLIGGAGADTLDGTGGLSYADYSTAAGGLIANIADTSGNLGDATGDAFLSIYGIVGSAFDDVLRIGNADGAILGSDGNDWLIGGAGNDDLEGGNGIDHLIGGGGIDHLIGGAGADVLDGTGGLAFADYSTAMGGLIANIADASGNLGDATGDSFISVYGIVGSLFDDVLRIGNAGGAIFGNDGNDYLIGGDGADTLIGGSGIDHLIGGRGADVLDGTGGLSFADYSTAAGGLIANTADTAGNLGDATGDSFLSIYGVVGSAFDDVLRIGDGGGAILGNNGNDWLIGGAGADTLTGGEGIDHLLGGGGGDTLDGGAGFDFADYSGSIAGLTVNLSTPAGNTGDAAADSYNSIEGITGSELADSLQVGDGGGSIWANGGSDQLFGGSGADDLHGGAGDDGLYGSGGADFLEGGAGFDTFVLGIGHAQDVTLADFAGNGAAAGDSLLFAGFGTTGATFTQTDVTHWTIDSADGLAHETIVFSNAASIDASDYQFV